MPCLRKHNPRRPWRKPPSSKSMISLHKFRTLFLQLHTAKYNINSIYAVSIPFPHFHKPRTRHKGRIDLRTLLRLARTASARLTARYISRSRETAKAPRQGKARLTRQPYLCPINGSRFREAAWSTCSYAMYRVDRCPTAFPTWEDMIYHMPESLIEGHAFLGNR